MKGDTGNEDHDTLKSPVKRQSFIRSRPPVYSPDRPMAYSKRSPRHNYGWNDNLLPESSPQYRNTVSTHSDAPAQSESDEDLHVEESDLFNDKGKHRTSRLRIKSNVHPQHEQPETYFEFIPECDSPMGKMENIRVYFPKSRAPEGRDAERRDVPESSITKILALIVFLVVFFLFVLKFEGTNTDVTALSKLKEKIKTLQMKFPTQNKKIWNTIFSGIKTIATDDPTVPSVFLLLYDSEKLTSACLAREVGKEAVEFLSESGKDPLIVQGENLKSNLTIINDHGWFLKEYQSLIEDKHVMIVYNLQEIPAVVAQTFHFLCDSENPLIKKAAYLFTLQVRDKLEGKNDAALAESTLRTLWRESLDEDIVAPLITRITDTVFSVNPEPQPPCTL